MRSFYDVRSLAFVTILILSFVSAQNFAFAGCESSFGTPALPPIAISKFTPMLHFEFGAIGQPDRIVLREKSGWFGRARRVIFEGRITRIPLFYRVHVPNAVSDRVSAYQFSQSTNSLSHVIVVGTSNGAFVISIMPPRITTFTVLMHRPLKYIVNARITSAERLAKGDGKRNHFDSKYVLVTLQEGESVDGYTLDELYKSLQNGRKNGNSTFAPEAPVHHAATWLVKADREPAADLSDASYYHFGSKSSFVGEGDYSGSKMKIVGDHMVITPRRNTDVENIADPTQRDGIRIMLP